MKPGHSTLLLFLTLAALLSGCLFNSHPEEKYLEKARAYAAGGYRGAATIELKKALESSPAHIPSLKLLDKITTGNNKSEVMLPYLSRALQAGVEDYDISLMYVGACLDQQQYQKALTQIQKLKKSDQIDSDRSTQLHILKANAFIGLRKFEKAEKFYSDLLNNPSKIRTAQMGLARIIIEKIKHSYPFHPAYFNTILPGHQYLITPDKRSEHAQFTDKIRDEILKGEKLVKQVLEVLPDNHEANLYLSELFYYKGSFSQSIEAANRALAKDQRNTRGLFLLAKSNIMLGYHSAAQQNLIQLLAIDKTDLDASNTLASLYLKNNNADDASALLVPFLKQGLRNEDLYINLGISEAIKDDQKKSITYFKQAVKEFPDSAYAHAQLGASYLNNKQYKLAIREFKEARFSDIGNLEISLGLIQTNMISGKTITALRFARTLVGQHPDSPSPPYVLGLIYKSQNKVKRSIDQFKKALSINPLFFPSRIQLARDSLSNNEIKTAEQILKKGLELEPGQINISLELALVEEQNGEVDKAINRLESITLNSPFTIPPKVALGRIYLKKDDLNHAILIKKDLNKYAPQSPKVISFNAEVYKKLGNVKESVKMYQKLTEIFPGNINYQVQLASAYSNLKNFSSARKLFDHVTKKIENPSPSILAKMTNFEIQQNNIGTARNYIKMLLKTPSGKIDGYKLYADVLLKENKLTKAIKIFSRTLKKETDPEVIKKISFAYLQLNQKKKAKRFLRKWIKKLPDSLDISLAAINYFQQTGGHQSALAECERILKILPDNILILNKLAQIYQSSNKDLAWEYAIRAYNISEESPEVLNTYGIMCIDKGRYSEGLDSFKRAVSAAPGMTEYQYNLAEGLYKSGKSDYAKDLLKKTLNNKDPFPERIKAEKLLAELEKGFFE